MLFRSIANSNYLTDYLKTKVNSIKILEFADHHFFVREDIGLLKRSYNEMTGRNKIVITTEKDAIRLEQHYGLLNEYQLPMFVLPVQVAFHGEGETERFQDDIADYLLAVRR